MKRALLVVIIMSSGCASIRRAPERVRRAASETRRTFTARTPYQWRVLGASAVPGGGWVYECNASPGPCEHDVSPGVWYAGATAALAYVLVNQHAAGPIAAAASGLFVVRFADVFGAMRAAKRAEGKR